MSNTGIFALLMLIALLSLILVRLEIGFAIGIISYLWLFLGDHPTQRGVIQIFSSLDTFVMLAVPFFLFAGEIMNRGEISENIFLLTNIILGRFRGGLAQANVVASLLFAGLTGAAVADVAALGSIFIPEMEEQGYEKSFSAAVTAASSIVGPIIPPSIIIVLYGAVTRISIGGLFVAAIIPGILLGIVLMIAILIYSRTKNLPTYHVNLSDHNFVTLGIYPLLAFTMPAIILIGIIGGYFTPTEAAAVACAYGIFIGVAIFRTLDSQDIYTSLKITVERTGQLLLIFGFGGVFSFTLAREGIPELIAKAILGLGLGEIGFMILVSIILLFIGAWMDVGAALIILAPIFSQIAAVAGIHPLQFGIVMILALTFGMITPPFGIVLFATSSVAKIPVEGISRDVIPFFLVQLIVLLLLILVPELTLYLPTRWGLA